MEDRQIANPFKRFCMYHWGGVFHSVTFLILFPICLIQPNAPFATLFVWILMFLWHVAHILPTGITGLIPIIIFPTMGVMSSEATCMNYARDSASVFFASCLMAIAFNESKTSEQMAYIWVKMCSHRPHILLITLMQFTWLLSTVVPNAVVCALMIPLTKNIIQVLEVLSIGKLVSEKKQIEDDEPPYPSNLTNGLAIGVAFAATIGGIVTLNGSDVATTMYLQYQKMVPNAKGHFTYLDYLSVGLPISFLLLIFTIFYLEVVFLGLFRKTSPDNLKFDDVASRNALQIVINELPSFSIHHCLVIIFYILLLFLCIFLQPLYMEGLADVLNEKILLHSTICIVVCFAIFVLPSSCSFCKYFICKAPAAFERTPSILEWSSVPKNMPWHYYLAYGGSAALAEAIKRANWSIYISKFVTNDLLISRTFYLIVASILTTMGADHLVATNLFGGAALHYLKLKKHPGNVVHSLTFGSQMAFLLPISSVANCFACGWFNIRTRHVMLAAIGPIIVGFLLNALFVVCVVPKLHPEFDQAPY